MRSLPFTADYYLGCLTEFKIDMVKLVFVELEKNSILDLPLPIRLVPWNFKIEPRLL